MVNNVLGEKKKKKATEWIEEYSDYLRSHDYCETTVSMAASTIAMVAKDLEVSLIDATTDDLREVLCRYYDRVRPSSLNQYRSILVGFYRYLFICDYITSNPATKIPRRVLPKKLPSFIEQSVVDMILTHGFDINDPIDFQRKCIFELMLYCGMKCGEIASLTTYNTVIFKDGIAILSGKKVIRFYPQELISQSSLCNYINNHPKDITELFPSYTTSRSIQYMVKSFMIKYCDRYNVTPMTLRHSFAIAMINRGVRDIYISHLLGTKVLHNQNLYKYCNIDILKREYSKYFSRK